MKKLIALAVLVLASSAPAPTTNTPSVTLGWDRVADQTVAGYRVYHGIAARSYTNFVTVSGVAVTTVTITNLARGVTYHFAATCYTTNGLESDYSAEVTYATTPIPPVPAAFKITASTP